MNAVDDGAFDLDAALVLVRVDPRRGCAELHRLLAGEVAAYSRALGVIDVGDHVDEVFDRTFRESEAFAGHGRDFRMHLLATTADTAHERLGPATGTELGIAVLLGVMRCTVVDAAAISGRSQAFVAANRPGPTATRYHRRRFCVDDPPEPGPALTVHMGPRPPHLPLPGSPRDVSAGPAGPRRNRARWAAVAALLLTAGAVATEVVGGRSESDADTVALAGTAVVVSNPTPSIAAPSAGDAAAASGPETRSAANDTARTPAEDGEPTAWSYDVGAVGRVVGTIDDHGHLHATAAPAPGWDVDVDEDTPPWFQATFTDGVVELRFLAIADGGVVRVWVFDLSTDNHDDHDDVVAPPSATPRPNPRPPASTPTPEPRPRDLPAESPPPHPEPAPPEGGGDRADATPTPPAPRPTPDEPDATPTPDDPVATPTPDNDDEPDEPPTPDDPDEPDEPDDPDETPTPDDPAESPTPDDSDDEGSGNSGRGGGSGSDPDRSGSGSGASDRIAGDED